MLVRLRLRVRDRPGTLGQVASALGVAGADISRIEVLESESGRAVDDVFVEVRDEAHLDRVRKALGGVAGLEVLGVQQPAPPLSGHAELELVARIVGRPAHAAQTLVDGAPLAIGADWAALLSWGEDGLPAAVVTTSPDCPGAASVVVDVALRLTTLRITPPGATEPYGGAALIPLGGTGLGLVVVRERGPGFHRSELWRLAQVGDTVGSVLDHA